MQTIIIGMGIQGNKRKKFLKKNLKYTVDKFVKADFKSIYSVPLKSFDSAIICVPDNQKLKIMEYCIKNKKDILVEKPILFKNKNEAKKLDKMAKKNKVVVYTAFNHRFEPHFMEMKKLIKSKKLGKIYSCRMFYGNGTASLVKNSGWKDTKHGILTDLGSHLLDTCLFWFGKNIKNFKTVSTRKFENKSIDHTILISDDSRPKIEIEMTYLMWKNHFTCDVLAEKGSAHIESLCKWGPTTFTYRKRVYPSGKPKDIKKFLIQSDPTWLSEINYFKKLRKNKNFTDFEKNLWIQKQLIESMDYKLNKNK